MYAKRDQRFGNARLVRNVFERIQQEHAERISALENPDRNDLISIESTDVLAAIESFGRTPTTEIQKGSLRARTCHIRS
ncbi:MAG: hypothetical protein ACR2JB_09440 [Bryobacteraceae bacterium]